MWLLSCKPEHWQPPIMEITMIGLDLAKNVFQAHAIRSTGEVVVRRALRRAQVLPFFSKLVPYGQIGTCSAASLFMI
jgi:transposase